MQLYQIIILLTLHWVFVFALCKSEADSHGNVICFIGHTIISFIMNTINNKLWNAKSLRQLFINIGFEQLLYQLFLVISFYLLNL